MSGNARKQAGASPLFLSYGLYTLSMLIFGTNGLIVARLSLRAAQIVLLRTLLGGAVLTLPVLLRGGFDRAALRADAPYLLLGGAVLGANWVALFEAFRLLNVSLATLIYYVGPMLVLLFSPLLFGEKLRGAKLAAVAVVAAGLVCISGSIVFGEPRVGGLLAAILSALFYASLIVLNKRIVHTGGMQTAALELDAAFVVVLLYVMLTTGLPRPTRADLPYLALLGLVNTGLAYGLYFSGLQRLPAQSVALISYLDPASTLLYSALFLRETLTPLQLLGAVGIIGGAVFGELRREPPKKEGKETMDRYHVVTLREVPEREKEAAAWFHGKWGVPEEAYLACMDDYLSGETEYGWYLCLDEGGAIVGGLGVIENDFHDRKDLAPNVCAVYTEEAHRCRGVAGRLLDTAVEDMRDKGVSPLYLFTDHIGFYERYGWEFLCMAQGDGEDRPTRLYIHK